MHHLRPIRSAVVALLAVGVLLVATGTAAAQPLNRDGASVAAPGKPGGGGPGGGGARTRGFDISYPQCGGAYPASPAFGIVGVNGGRVFSTNPCLASQVTWGGGAATELYVNTGNPGPGLSQFWPVGQTSPRTCSSTNTDTADCAYDYGWNAALAAYASLGLGAGAAAATTWWLDVETMNSWRSTASLNVAALQGQVDYLRSVGITKLGFYSTTVQWGTITGGSQVFAAYPSWGAGAPNEKTAKSHCQSTPGFTGGRLALVQYPYAGYDADLRC